MRTCGVILCGGKSSRMGENKSLLPLHGKKVIEHITEELSFLCDEVVLSTNDFNSYEFLQLPMYADRYQNKGPLAGIESVLYQRQADTFIIAACDMPFINHTVYKDLLGKLGDYDAVVPIYHTQLHPLSAIYRKQVLHAIQHQLERDELQVKSFFRHINVNFVKEFNQHSTDILEKHFFNMNNPTEYELAKNF